MILTVLPRQCNYSITSTIRRINRTPDIFELVIVEENYVMNQLYEMNHKFVNIRLQICDMTHVQVCSLAWNIKFEKATKESDCVVRTIQGHLFLS